MATDKEKRLGHSLSEKPLEQVRPLKSAPILFTFNGCGFGMYGKRDFDPSSGTYTKTRCLCLLFVPVLALDAFRVADAGPKSWYFVGRVALSRFAKGARWAVLGLTLLVGGSISLNHYRESPAYLAKMAREKASALVSQSLPIEALEVYRGAIRDGIGNADQWRQSMVSLMESEISSGDPQRAAAALRYSETCKGQIGGADGLLPNLADLAIAASEKATRPDDAMEILSAFQPAPTDLVRVHQALRKSLEELHKKDPGNQDLRVRLALIREEFGEVAGALDLLRPAEERLGDGEGARLYGHLLLGEGDPTGALVHLERYAASRVAVWTRAEEDLSKTYERSEKRALEELNQSGGPSGFRARYEAADEKEQARMVNEYLTDKVQKDHAFQAAQDRYEKASRVVPAIMDLGVARLRIAQSQTDPEKRKPLLKSAEEAFLSLKNAAGQSDEYRLFLGQIYFWSGREAEGRALFDELLASKGRDTFSLFSLANIFRDLGELNDARKLLEEAYPKARDVGEKNQISSLRSLLATSLDERIEWLSKGDGDPAGLAKARAEKAEEGGDTPTAIARIREAIAIYEKQGRTATSLNNTAIAYAFLYRLDGKASDFVASARLQSEAVALSPTDGILCFNAAVSQLDAAVLRVIGDRLDPRLIQTEPGLPLLRYLYDRESDREVLISALRADPSFRKAIGHFWDALLLSPKSTTLYGWGFELFGYLNDLQSLEKLAQKAAEQEFDFADQGVQRARYLSGQDDDKLRSNLRADHDKMTRLRESLKDERSHAFALGLVVSSDLAGYPIGSSVHPEQWLVELKTAVKDHSCSRLRSTLEIASRIIAIEALSKEDPECAKIIEADRRLMSADHLLSLLVRDQGDLGKRVRMHPAVIAARELLEESPKLFPSSFGNDEWLLLEGLRPQDDPKLRQLLMSNPLRKIEMEVIRKLQPETSYSLMTRFWNLVVEGDLEAARQLIPGLEKEGVKLTRLF